MTAPEELSVPQPSLSVIPSPYTIVHIPRSTTETLDPDTGNPVIVEFPPVIRFAQAISQIGRLRGSSRFVYSAEFVKRVETDLHIAVADPAIYSPLDQVLLFPEINEYGEYVQGTGYAFFVDGVSYDGRTSPWPLFTKALGGMVRLRRVS
jgi:hypothetical protein